MKTKLLWKTANMLGLLMICSVGHVQAQVVNANIMTRTFPIKYHDRSGTSFTIDVDKRQYLITAKHLVNGIKPGDMIEIFRNNEWQPLHVTPILCANTNVDIVVLIPPTPLSPSFPIKTDIAGLIMGQDMYFLGYPYGLHSDVYGASGTPLAFIKKGICSAWEFTPPDCKIIYLDGYNNPGFSGGPVVFQEQATKELKIAGVVAGFRYEDTQVNNRNLDTGLTVKANTGIVVAYGIISAVDAIKKNPKGPLIE